MRTNLRIMQQSIEARKQQGKQCRLLNSYHDSNTAAIPNQHSSHRKIECTDLQYDKNL